jgi:hypothetical protein
VEKVEQQEPQSAADYDERTTAAVKAVLVEMGQVLGSFKGKFAVIGGAVPWLLLENEDMNHVGTLDVDIGLDAESLGDGEYKTLVEALMSNGYSQRKELKKFQLVRQVDAKDGGPPIDVIVDFLMPRDAKIEKNKPVLVDNFAVQRADGADLPLRFYQMVAIDGAMPGGGKNRVEIACRLDPCAFGYESFRDQRSPQAKRCLRYLLLRSKFSRWTGSAGERLPANSRPRERQGRLWPHCGKIREA